MLTTMRGQLKGVLMIAFLAWAGMWVLAQNTSKENGQESVSGPKIEFKYKTWDFGEVPEGPKVRHEFEFTNTGNEPLIIHQVRSSCGCTVPYWPREPIPPGGKGKITVEYNTAGRPGPFYKVVTIYSNANPPTEQIVIKGVVVRKEATTGPERDNPFGEQAR